MRSMSIVGSTFVVMAGIIVTGCTSSGVVRVEAHQPTREIGLIRNASPTSPIRIAVLMPEVAGNLTADQGQFWAERLRTEIERDMRAEARRTKANIEIVSPPEDYAKILDRNDREMAGVVDGNGAPRTKIMNWDICVKGSINLVVDEGMVAREAWKPEFRGLSIPSAIGGAANKDNVYCPTRKVAADATLQMICANGRRISFAPEEIEVVEREGNPGSGIFNRAESLPARNEDIQVALSRVSHAYVAVFFPNQSEERINVESGPTQESRDAVNALMAARDPEGRARAIDMLKNASDLNPRCHRTQFALAIAYEANHQYDQALSCCKSAIDLRGKKFDSKKTDELAAMKRDPYLNAEKRIVKSICYSEAIAQLNEQQTQDEAPALQTVDDATSREARTARSRG